MTEISRPSALVITRVLSSEGVEVDSACSESLCLSWHARQRCRQRVHTDQGTEVCLALPRGTVLRDGDLLYQDLEQQIWVRAQSEDLLQITPRDRIQLAQIAHHLGNWHRSAQLLEDGTLLVQSDPPLQTWLRDKQIQNLLCRRPFDPNLSGQSH